MQTFINIAIESMYAAIVMMGLALAIYVLLKDIKK